MNSKTFLPQNLTNMLRTYISANNSNFMTKQLRKQITTYQNYEINF